MFSNTARRLLQFVGGTKLTDLPKEWQASVERVLSEQETAVRHTSIIQRVSFLKMRLTE
jgi:hypothetical protein